MTSQDHQSPAGSAVEDAWLSCDDAARILGVSQRTVFRMVDRGELETRGRYAHLNFSRASIEAAQQRGQAISLTVAARIMSRSPDFVRGLIAAGELTSFSNPKWPVFQLEVEQYALAHPPTRQRVGQMTAKGASEMLGLSIGHVRKLAAAGLIPSDQDDHGRYWFRREHLALYLRARATAAAAEQLSPGPASPDWLG